MVFSYAHSLLTSSVKQTCASFSSLFCCGGFGSCVFYGPHDSWGHCCCGCLDAYTSSSITLVQCSCPVNRNRQNIKIQPIQRMRFRQTIFKGNNSQRRPYAKDRFHKGHCSLRKRHSNSSTIATLTAQQLHHYYNSNTSTTPIPLQL